MLENLFERNGKVDLTKHILLLLFTFGIYHLIWIYKMTEYTNRTNPNQIRDATVNLLLCMFVPFYSIFWYIKTAEILNDSISIQNDNFKTMVLITSILVPFIASIIIQDEINKSNITEMHNPIDTKQSAKSFNAVQSNESSTIELIKKLKELLDMGAITQEEFDIKKRELL